MSTFDVVSPLPTTPAAGDWLVVDNQNADDVYSGLNRVAIVSAATALPDPSRTRVTVTGLPEHAAKSQLADDLIGALMESGITRNHITFASRPGPVTLLTEYFVVAAPPCPDQDDDHGGTQPSRTAGCTVLQNFVSMVADPADLVGRGTTGPAMADTPVAAVTRYRTDKLKDFLAATSTSSSSH